MSTNDNIRRRALLGASRNTDAHECMVEYEFPRSDINFNNASTLSSPYSYTFGPSNITHVNWPSGIKHIFQYAFCNSSISLSNFNEIPSTVEVIDQYAFNECRNFSGGSITLPAALKFVGSNAFYHVGISSLTIQGDIIAESNAFGNNNQLTTINVGNYVIAARGSFSPILSSGWLTNQSKGNVYLGKNYVQYKGTMPANTNLTIESGTRSIWGYAFSNKTTLKSITIPNSVEFIGIGAFSGCSGLTEITIPENLNPNFTKSYTQANSIYSSTGGSGGDVNSSYSPFYSGKCTGITTVNWNAIDFRDSDNTSTHNFLGGGTYLPNVTTVNIGSQVQTIPTYFISGFKKVTSITIPNSVTLIEFNAFYNCTGLTSITIPESVTTIDASIISGCTSITTINFNAISCHSTYSSPTYLFGGNLSLVTSVNIGNQVQVIPLGFLYGLTSITSITIPSSVTTLDKYSFYRSKLTSIDLPASVTSIGNYAFHDCLSLTSITIRSTTPPTLDSSYTSTFPTTSQSYTIYVPASVVNTYKTTSKWSYWSSKIQAIPS
jgi:hypothetical protein